MKFWLTLFFYTVLLTQAKSQQQNGSTISGKITVNKNGIEGVVIRNESSNISTTSAIDGGFSIICNSGDVLHFSSVNLEIFRKKIRIQDLQLDTVIIEMVSKIIDLDEVIITKNPTITAEKLRIIPENQKKYTLAERRLKTAGDFKPIHLLGLLGGSLALDPIINAISGRTGRLKKELIIEQKERLMKKLKALYNEKFYELNLKISKIHIETFRYFCIENQDIVSYLASGNKQLLQLKMSELAITFNKNKTSEE